MHDIWQGSTNLGEDGAISQWHDCDRACMRYMNLWPPDCGSTAGDMMLGVHKEHIFNSCIGPGGS